MAVNISETKVFPQVQIMLEDSAVVASTCRDVSEFATKGATSLNFPTRLPREAQIVTVGSAIDLTKNSNNYGPDVLALDKIAADYDVMDLHLEQENIFNGNADAIEDMVKAIGVALDKDLIAKAIAAASETAEERSTDFYADCVNMRKAFRKAKIPLDNVYLALTADDEALALNTKEFKSFNENGSGETIRTGVIGMIAGMKVILPTISEADGFTESFAYHSLGLVYAWHGDMILQQVEAPKSLAQEVSLSRKFGAKAVQAGALVYKWKAPVTP